MNTRELTPHETEKEKILKESGITYERLFLTETGLKQITGSGLWFMIGLLASHKS